MVKFLNWNIASANTKKVALIAHCKTEQYDIITLQETLLKPGHKFKLNGYNIYTTPHENSNRGLAILIKSSIPVKKINNPISCGDNTEVLAVTITLQNGNLDIYNIYRNIHHGELDLIQLGAHASNTNTLITGDFNAHHPVLSSPSPTNDAGEHIAHLLQDFHNISIINNGEATHIRGGRLDLTFITATLRTITDWKVHPTLMSDHFATITCMQTPTLPPIPPPPPRWNQDLADWHIFQKEIEQWATNYEIPENIDLFEEHIIKAFHDAATKQCLKKLLVISLIKISGTTAKK